RLAQPAPQERAAIAAAAVQGYDQRTGDVGLVVFRHVEREGAARARWTADMHDAHLVPSRYVRQVLDHARVVARRGLEEELADRLQEGGQRVKRFRRLGVVAYRAVGGDDRLRRLARGAQLGDALRGGLGGGFEAFAHRAEPLGPFDLPRLGECGI